MPVISIDSFNSTSVTFSWTLSTQEVSPTGFMLYYTNNGSQVMSEMVSSVEREYMFSNLQPGSTINISLIALSNYLPSATVVESVVLAFHGEFTAVFILLVYLKLFT